MRELARLDTDETVALAWLVHAMGRKHARLLLAEMGNVRDAVTRIEAGLHGLDEFAARIARMQSSGQRLIAHTDPAFPPLLRAIPDAPLVLYVQGDIESVHAPAIAVVGARRCSRSGSAHAAAFGRDLAVLGFTVVSGLALGIDAAAHRGALQTGVTAAVVGSGLAQLYPQRNASLAQEILEKGGTVISEHAPDVTPRTHHFPERNRLISGLSLGVLVVEAGERSGSLITARCALEQGRDVLAVPGAIDNPAARGCHRLLREGAYLVETVADIVGALRVAPPVGAMLPPRPIAPEPADAALRILLHEVGRETTTLDALCTATGTAAAIVATRLVELELAGFVKQVTGGYIRRPPEFC
jgi:DNA processing protein